MSETQEQAGSLGAWFALMKPGVILLLQVTQQRMLLLLLTLLTKSMTLIHPMMVAG